MIHLNRLSEPVAFPVGIETGNWKLETGEPAAKFQVSSFKFRKCRLP